MHVQNEVKFTVYSICDFCKRRLTGKMTVKFGIQSETEEILRNKRDTMRLIHEEDCNMGKL